MALWECPRCSARYPEDVKKCPQCGRRTSQPPPKPKKSEKGKTG